MTKRPIEAGPLLVTTLMEVVAILVIGIVVGGALEGSSFLVLGLVIAVILFGGSFLYPMVYDRMEGGR